MNNISIRIIMEQKVESGEHLTLSSKVPKIVLLSNSPPLDLLMFCPICAIQLGSLRCIIQRLPCAIQSSHDNQRKSCTVQLYSCAIESCCSCECSDKAGCMRSWVIQGSWIGGVYLGQVFKLFGLSNTSSDHGATILYGQLFLLKSLSQQWYQVNCRKGIEQFFWLWCVHLCPPLKMNYTLQTRSLCPCELGSHQLMKLPWDWRSAVRWSEFSAAPMKANIIQWLKF